MQGRVYAVEFFLFLLCALDWSKYSAHIRFAYKPIQKTFIRLFFWVIIQTSLSSHCGSSTWEIKARWDLSTVVWNDHKLLQDVFSQKSLFLYIRLSSCLCWWWGHVVWQTSALHWRLHSSVKGRRRARHSDVLLTSQSQSFSGGQIESGGPALLCMCPMTFTLSVHIPCSMCFVSKVGESWVIFTMQTLPPLFLLLLLL